MKRPIRPLISILMLVALAATLSCRITILRAGGGFPDSAEPYIQAPPIQVFNSTLLKFAAVDIGEEKSKLEIEQLLEGNFASQGRYMTFATWRRFNHHDVTARNSKGLPVMLRLVKVHIDSHNGLTSSDNKYKSCAVVGNSGILLNSDHGKLIDGHEAVIRLNMLGPRGGKGVFVTLMDGMFLCPRFDALSARIVKYYSVKRFVEETGKPLGEWGSTHDGSMFHYSSGMQAVTPRPGLMS
ncbi:putative Zinc finger A20 and AN1 domain-containing stress-associated protein 3 [Hibiscus syriacus]|uniref:Zinc finger A20 and AN1 domain-containing stress-associated protein 3 n=1 Tax=Hibiscus syriacus TaxID=106335 RepID=A0A6A2ZHM7_HIBSY|nr:putative Zinc finger A20 and AN1 domain-containing stress-associated protein 3 [Hibiscus syriacus]